MTEGHCHHRSSIAGDCRSEKPLIGDPTSDPLFFEEQNARIQLRGRWELAAVLHFLRIFRPVIPKDLKIPAEEIETALITANEKLGLIHIALLKGIPPANKNKTVPDAWITSVCKKLQPWWSWVAEGDNPIKVDHGKEILSYKQLDPISRLLMLKALCDVRAEFISDELKNGTQVDAFRKERMKVGNTGVTYWYEGDSVIGCRLYKQTDIIDSKQNAKGKSPLPQPTLSSQWETIATNPEEFPEIIDILSSSKLPGEAFVGEIIKTDILPFLEKLLKKKERDLKQQQRQIILIESFQNYQVRARRACRELRPVRYTFDEYDRVVDDAIDKSMEPNDKELMKGNGEHYNNGLENENNSTNASIDTMNVNENPGNEKPLDSSDSDDDDDYDDGYDEEEDDSAVDSDSDKEKEDPPSKSAQEKIHFDDKLHSGLRRSCRNASISNQGSFDACHVVAKKRLRQRPIENTSYFGTISDSEDDIPSKSVKQTVH